jgi:short-subunit dehydrogenase
LHLSKIARQGPLRKGSGQGMLPAMGTFHGWGGAALVTGASSGIGRALAVHLARRRMPVIVTARSKDALEELARTIREAHGVRVEVVAVDLSTPDGPRRLVDECRRIGLPIDLLVNNAGFGVYGRFPTQGPEREAELVRLNIQAPVELAAHFVPEMVARGHGVVMNVASTAAFRPVPWIGSYAASKAHLLSWTHSLDVELRGTGVRACVLCPGSTETNFHHVSGASGRQKRNNLGRQTADQVAKEALEGVDRGKRVIVTGWINRLHTGLAQLVPAGLATELAFRVMGPARRSQDAR